MEALINEGLIEYHHFAPHGKLIDKHKLLLTSKKRKTDRKYVP